MTGVGDRLYPGRSLPEGVAVHGGRGWLILVSVDAPTREECGVINAGLIDLAIEREGPVLLWMMRAQPEQDRLLPARRGMRRGPRAPRVGVGWSAAAWPWWDRRELTVEHVDGSSVAQVVLVHSPTTQVRAMRSIALTPRITTRIAELEADAIAEGRDEIALERAVRWTLRSDSATIEARAVRAMVRTGVREKAS